MKPLLLSTVLAATTIAAPAIAQAQIQSQLQTEGHVIVTDAHGWAYVTDRTADRHYDPVSGLTTNRQNVTPSGALISSQGQIQCNSAGQCFRDGHYIGPRGRSRQSTSAVTVLPDGTVQGTTLGLRPDGSFVSRDRVSTPTADGRTGSVVTDNRFGTTTRAYDRGYVPGEGTYRAGTAIGPSGNTVTTSGSASCHSGVCTRDGTVTGPYGNSRTSAGESRYIAPGQRAGSRTVTGPLDQSRTRDRSWRRVRR